MERLTVNYEDGTVGCKKNADGPCNGLCEYCEHEGKVYKKLAHYENLEDQLKEVYGECDGLLETAMKSLIRHEKAEFEKPQKARLLTDEAVDEWEEYKKLKSEGLLYRKVWIIERLCGRIFPDNDCDSTCEYCSGNNYGIQAELVEISKLDPEKHYLSLEDAKTALESKKG